MSKIANAFKGGNGKAFIPFITCGDPSLEVTEQLVYAMEEAGANLFSYGTERFIKKASELGMDGLILPDVPYEEKEEFDSLCKKYDMDLISLIAPTSHERISMIAKEASGFVYCVSSLGVTGTRSEITTDIGAMVKLVKKAKDIPCAVGFGISTPEQAKKMAGLSDGAIVGSAIVKLCGTYGKDAVPYVKEYVKSMCDAVHGI